MEVIEAALKERGIQCSYSEDAGGYLCNYIFYISRSGLCPGLNPKVSGFIHIPPLREGGVMDKPNAMDMAEIIEAGKIVIEESIKAFQQYQGGEGTDSPTKRRIKASKALAINHGPT